MKILSAIDYSTKLRVSIQTSGKLSFSYEAASNLGINENSVVKFGQDDNDSQILYLIIPSVSDEQCFPVKPSGRYFYVPTKTLFDALKIDYENQTIIFDLIRMTSLDEECGGKAFKMNMRVIAD